MSEGYVTCPMCAFAFEKADTTCAHSCPLGAMCRLLRCPSCGYEFPQTPASVSWLERLLGRRSNAACDLPEGVRTLGDLRAGEAACVVCVGSEGAARPSALAAFGLVPGAVIRLVQRQPACVVRIDETELALDGEVADEILVGPIGSAHGGSSLAVPTEVPTPAGVH